MDTPAVNDVRIYQWIDENRDCLLDVYYELLDSMAKLGCPPRSRISSFTDFCVFVATQLVRVVP